MKTKLSLVLSTILAVAACRPAEQAVPEPPSAPIDGSATVTALADEYVADYFATFPEHAPYFGAPDLHPDRLSDHSREAMAAWQSRQDKLLERLETIDVATVTNPASRVSYDILRFLLESERDYRVCRMNLWNVSPTWTGWHAELTLLAGILPVETQENRANVLKRLKQVPAYLQQEIANLREGVELGYTAPANNVRSVIEQVDAMLASPVAESPFVQAIVTDNLAFQQQLQELVETGINPAITSYRAYLSDEYLEHARVDIGVSANPDGLACYRAAVRLHSTVGLSAGQVHDMGLDQMEIIMEQMREIGERSFGISDPGELIALVKSDPEYMFSSRDELIGYAVDAVERSEEALPEWFGLVPKAPVIVEPYPAFQEKSAPGGQAVPPSADGSKPGKYLINAYQAKQQSIAGLESTAFHEAYPGHHLQGSIALQRKDLHPISRYFFLSGFGEGWALYSERLADEMGLFSSDVDRLGLLSNEALRAARLVVDSGMHTMGWSREEAVEYLDTHTADSRSRAEAEIDRYIAVPGQATAYMIGNLEIGRLREEAEAALGARFDIRDFHDLVLEDGAVPLSVLAQKVDRRIEASLAESQE
jgi:uncharacterized protein (DUF885 family)